MEGDSDDFRKKRDNTQVDNNCDDCKDNEHDDGLQQLPEDSGIKPKKMFRVDVTSSPSKKTSAGTQIPMQQQQSNDGNNMVNNTIKNANNSGKRRQLGQQLEDQNIVGATSRRKLLQPPSHMPPMQLMPSTQVRQPKLHHEPVQSKAPPSTAAAQSPKALWDVESALHIVVQQQDKSVKEYLSSSNTTYVTFRVGHAGDASTIAHCYRKFLKRCKQRQQRGTQQRPGHNQDDDMSSSSSSSTEPTRNDTVSIVGNRAQDTAVGAPAFSEISARASASPAVVVDDPTSIAAGSAAHSGTKAKNDTKGTDEPPASPTPSWDESAGLLELWLADGMGDEDTPPAVFCLLAYVSNDHEEEGKTCGGNDSGDNARARAQENPICHHESNTEQLSSPSRLREEGNSPSVATATTNEQKPAASQPLNQNNSCLGAVAVVTLAWSHDIHIYGSCTVASDVHSPSSIASTHAHTGGNGGSCASNTSVGRGRRILRVEWLYINESVPSLSSHNESILHAVGMATTRSADQSSESKECPENNDCAQESMSSTLRHRLWLRLAVLANITGCELQLANSNSISHVGNDRRNRTVIGGTNSVDSMGTVSVGRQLASLGGGPFVGRSAGPNSSRRKGGGRLPPPSAE